MVGRSAQNLALGALGFALLPALTGCPGLVRTADRRPPDVVVVTWDTVRADRVGPEAAVPGLTPTWNRLATEGVRFAWARTPTPVTLPAHASLLTGLLPSRHGARENGLFTLDGGVATLAERLAAGGWQSAAFVSAAVLDARYGLIRGFDVYDDGVGVSNTRHAAERTADETVDAVLAWWRRVPADQPAFTWVHLFDPHRPWQAPASWRAAHPDDGYAAEIAFADAQTGRLLEALEELGRLDRTLVVLTSDHGESLGQHGEESHGYFAYDSSVRVPLMMWAGPRSGVELSGGLRVTEPVSLVDVAPTVADLLGLDPWAGDGRSLRPLLSGEPWSARELALENVSPAYLYRTAPIFGVVDADNHTWFDLPQREHYDANADPGQLHNLYDPTQEGVADALFARHPRHWPPETPARIPSESEAQALSALGYLHTGIVATRPRSAYSDGTDPKRLLPVAKLWMEAPEIVTPAEGLARADRLVARFGPLPALAIYRADRLRQLGRRAEAIEALAAAASSYPQESRLAEDLAHLRSAHERDTELAARIRATLAARPDHPGALRDLATVLHRLGELEEAEASYRRWLARNPGDDAARVALHRVLGAQGRLDESLRVLREGRDRSGHDPALDCAEGRLLAWWLSRMDEARPALRACRDGGGALAARELALLESGA